MSRRASAIDRMIADRASHESGREIAPVPNWNDEIGVDYSPAKLVGCGAAATFACVVYVVGMILALATR